MMQKGFSLPEITVALGLVAGVSLVTMKLVENNARNQNSLKASAEIQKTVALLKASLNEPNRCRDILINQDVGVGAGEGTPIGLTAGVPVAQGPRGLFQVLRNTAGAVTGYKELLKPNTAYPGFRTADITLRKSASSPADYAELVVNFANETDVNKRNDGSLAELDKGTRIVIPLVVKLNGTLITDCQPSVSEVNEAAREKFCRSLGNLAVWDSVGYPKTCKFRTHQCPYGQVPSVFQADGSLTCEPLSQQMNASDLFDATTSCSNTSGNIKIIEQGGKLRIDCN